MNIPGIVNLRFLLGDDVSESVNVACESVCDCDGGDGCGACDSCEGPNGAYLVE